MIGLKQTNEVKGLIRKVNCISYNIRQLQHKMERYNNRKIKIQLAERYKEDKKYVGKFFYYDPGRTYVSVLSAGTYDRLYCFLIHDVLPIGNTLPSFSRQNLDTSEIGSSRFKEITEEEFKKRFVECIEIIRESTGVRW